MGPTLRIFAPRARAPAMDFQEVIGAGGCEPRSGCEYFIYTCVLYKYFLQLFTASRHEIPAQFLVFFGHISQSLAMTSRLKILLFVNDFQSKTPSLVLEILLILLGFLDVSCKCYNMLVSRLHSASSRPSSAMPSTAACT